MRRTLSPVLCTVTAVAFVAGVGWGLWEFLTVAPGTPIKAHVPGTDAWGVHVVLTAAAAAWVALGARAKRTGTMPWLVPPNPVGRRFAAQWSALAPLTPSTFLRGIAAALLGFVLLYSVWRGGAQITGALDPRWTVNAWGGPGYLGALYCHYLDLALQIGVAMLLLRWILPTPRR
ncbi:hypothetical protein [Tsukamurella sp. 1534]|uniref:hypothetical protein n=1 Tax=Tsukamurella sp. 1534 TaxID=1151061 RepID=UPI0011D1DAC4|nr:hypothetical protein [Tsukamurella sp. 1534]